MKVTRLIATALIALGLSALGAGVGAPEAEAHHTKKVRKATKTNAFSRNTRIRKRSTRRSTRRTARKTTRRTIRRLANPHTSRRKAPKATAATYNSGYRVTRGTWQPLKGKRRRGRKTHFVEFRARSAHTYGHSSVVFGRLRNGRVPKNRKGVLLKGWYEIAGLAPASNSGTVYMLGHLVPLKATTGWTDGDDEDEYMTANYRIDLTRAEYNQIRKLIKRRQKASKFWNATVYACVHFTADVAKDIGLKVPRGFYLPKKWVNTMKAINTAR